MQDQTIQQINNLRRVHMVGIKGVGMAALAQILQNKDIRVSGSDVSEHFFTDDVLRSLGISYVEKFSEDMIVDDIDIVVYSTAYDPKNHEELLAAQNKGIPIISYPEFLGALTREYLSIAVCGTHGKTTSSAMLAHIMQSAEVDPTAIIGSRVQGWSGGALSGKGKHLVFEADEYQNKLAFYSPWSILLTSVDWDHPDYFPSEKEYEQVFNDFIQRLPGHGYLIINGDDSDVLRVCKDSNSQKRTFGFSVDNDYVIQNHVANEKGEGKSLQSFEIRFQGEALGPFEIAQAGKHNIMNAAGAVVMAHELHLDMQKVSQGLKDFKGTARRFEDVGNYKGAILIDDYAHHPREIEATLEAAKTLYPEKCITAVFQPHTFSRTEALFEEFSQCFELADKVYILDVYGAREHEGNVSGKDLADNISKYQYDKALYTGGVHDTIETLSKEIEKKNVVISMGAGDVWEVTKELSKKEIQD